MHLYLMTKMPLHIRETWLANMRSQMSEWPRISLTFCECGSVKDKHPTKKCKKFKGRVDMHRVQWNVKPIELWEVVAPEDAIPEIMWYCQIGHDKALNNGKKIKQVHGEKLELMAKVLRKGLGLKPLPAYDIDSLMVNPTRMISWSGGSIYGIGVKEDGWREFKDWDYKQEAL